jgi:hypothetical protein
MSKSIVSKFRKKPVVIEAVQWDGTYSGVLNIKSQFTGIVDAAISFHIKDDVVSEWRIATLEGSHIVSKGDFVIRGIKGEYYPCKPDIFEKTYEPASQFKESQPKLSGGSTMTDNKQVEQIWEEIVKYADSINPNECWYGESVGQMIKNAALPLMESLLNKDLVVEQVSENPYKAIIQELLLQIEFGGLNATDLFRFLSEQLKKHSIIIGVNHSEKALGMQIQRSGKIKVDQEVQECDANNNKSE